MTDYFGKVRGGFTMYYDESYSSDARYLQMNFGEDVDKVVATFWRERGDGDFAVIPLVAFGNAPRTDLCTQQSLVSALRSVVLETGSFTEQQWKACCEYHKVAWPKRLAA